MNRRILYIGMIIVGIILLIYLWNFERPDRKREEQSSEMNQVSSIESENKTAQKNENVQVNSELVEDKNKMDGNQCYINKNIANAVFLTGKLIYKNEVLETKYLNIYDNKSIELNDIELKNMVENLESNGWNHHDYKILNDGEYIISNTEQGNVITDRKEYEKIAKSFLEDSGLSAILLENGIQYELEVIQNNDTFTAFYYLLYEEDKTGSFIRMNFVSDKKLCAECMMYLYKSELMEQLKALSFKDAVKNAFYLGGSGGSKCDNNGYIVKNIRITYVNGLPYYHFTGYGVNNRKVISGYALAISIDESEHRNTLLEKPFSA